MAVASLVTLLSLLVGCSAAVKFPIVLVPGIAGSQLEAKHTKHLPYPEYCPSMKDWTQVWLRLTEVLPVTVNCLAKDLTFQFDPDTQQYSSPDGVETRVAEFGSTSSVEYLDASKDILVQHLTRYMHDMVEYFVDNAGYVRDESIVAAPYDWRRSPWSMDNWFENLTTLIETATSRYDAPAIIISHSMGGPVLQAFFNTTTPEWKAKHIAAWFPVDAPWIGAPKVLKAAISGDNFGTPAPSGDLYTMERTLESPIFLLPLAGKWPGGTNSTIVYVDKLKKTYNVSMFVELYEDLGVANASRRVLPVLEKRASLRPPGVRLYCIHGVGVDTPWAYEYSQFDGSGPTKTIVGDGDGTVPLPSLTTCSEWVDQQAQPVVVKAFPGVEHVQSIMDPTIMKYIHQQIDALAEN